MIVRPKVNGYPNVYYLRYDHINIIVKCYIYHYYDPNSSSFDVEAKISIKNNGPIIKCKVKAGIFNIKRNFEIKLDQDSPYVFINGHCITIEAKNLWNTKF